MNNTEALNLPTGKSICCPACESTHVISKQETEDFDFGQGAEAVALQATYLVHTCLDCESMFASSEAEDARERAIAQHLGIFSRIEVRFIRKITGLSRDEFANITGIGIASIVRWENGLVRQNKAMANLMHLMTFRENIERLRDRQGSPPPR